MTIATPKSKTRMRQFVLRDGDTKTVAWLADDPRLRVGVIVTLKTSDDPKRRWQIVRRSEPHDRRQIKRGWAAGGLTASEQIGRAA